jgi:hypothetical protein
MALLFAHPVYLSTMTPHQTNRSPLLQEPPPIPAWKDVPWSRPVFRAPPLRVDPPIPNLREFIAETQDRAFSR